VSAIRSAFDGEGLRFAVARGMVVQALLAATRLRGLEHVWESSIADARVVRVRRIDVPVQKPEVLLGWACFALMRVLADRDLDLEQARGFLKRCGSPERESLLHELAYLAA